ncbi:hypothetical protein [uncultured Methanobrevibacter sp.]|uniref:hypothetical protein n=1 Tax=uncultured Methanobrevibacter sp. TaxID=253161 RepID=UPI0025FBBAAD|nr:hypothetical protein [uncultured Methanobrevibacter sp.]
MQSLNCNHLSVHENPEPTPAKYKLGILVDFIVFGLNSEKINSTNSNFCQILVKINNIKCKSF